MNESLLVSQENKMKEMRKYLNKRDDNRNVLDDKYNMPENFQISGTFENSVKFIKINDEAKLPYKASNSAACSDLYSVEDVIILPGKTAMISTGLKVAHIPKGFRLDLYDRSGFRAKGIFGSSVGIIDEDYRGELKVILFNSTDKDFIVKIGDRIAQAALTPVQQVSYEFTETFEDTERSEGGFGSTGKN